MNKKRGFTLIELIAVITIIAIISLIAFQSVTNRIKKSKDKLYNFQINNLIEASRKYMLEENTSLDPYHTYTLCITVEQLQEKGFLEKGNIKNPKTNSKLDGRVKVKYNLEKDQYEYLFVNTCMEDKSSIPLSKYILNKEEVKVSGSLEGLYETTDSYVYRGENPNNYISFNNKIWRIVSVDKETNMVKMINLNDNNKNVNTVDELLKSLNENFETGTTYESVKDKVNRNSKLNKGVVDKINSALTIKTKEKQVNDYKTIGLLSLGEYIDASTNKNCYKENNCDSYLNTNKKYILLNAKTNDTQWYIDTTGAAKAVAPSNNLFHVYETLYLKLDQTNFSGSGTKTSPYVSK